MTPHRSSHSHTQSGHTKGHKDNRAKIKTPKVFSAGEQRQYPELAPGEVHRHTDWISNVRSSFNMGRRFHGANSGVCRNKIWSDVSNVTHNHNSVQVFGWWYPICAQLSVHLSYWRNSTQMFTTDAVSVTVSLWVCGPSFEHHTHNSGKNWICYVLAHVL